MENDYKTEPGCKMKKIIMVLIALSSCHAFAAPSITCKLPKMKTNLTIAKNRGKLIYFFKGGESGNVIEVLNFRRSDFQRSGDLRSVMSKTGLKIENFINATAYIIDSNSLGRSGLMVFKGGRSGRVAMSYFNSPTDHVQKCK